GGLSHDLRSRRKEMQIVHHRTSSQIKQVLALSAVPGTVALPMPDVRQIVLDSGSFTQRSASFTRALTNAQFLQQLLVRMQLDAPATRAACTTISWRTHCASPRRETYSLPRPAAHLDSLRATQYLAFPVHDEGRLGKEDACSYRPGLAEDLQLRTALAD